MLSLIYRSPFGSEPAFEPGTKRPILGTARALLFWGPPMLARSGAWLLDGGVITIFRCEPFKLEDDAGKLDEVDDFVSRHPTRSCSLAIAFSYSTSICAIYE